MGLQDMLDERLEQMKPALIAQVSPALIAQGRGEGREEGERMARLDTAKNLCLLGMLTPQQIAQVTGLSVDEVLSLS